LSEQFRVNVYSVPVRAHVNAPQLWLVYWVYRCFHVRLHDHDDVGPPTQHFQCLRRHPQPPDRYRLLPEQVVEDVCQGGAADVPAVADAEVLLRCHSISNTEHAFDSIFQLFCIKIRDERPVRSDVPPSCDFQKKFTSTLFLKLADPNEVFAAGDASAHLDLQRFLWCSLQWR
jgi:hypothetical protein